MKLPFLDRNEERSRLRRLVTRREPGLAVLYGRRRCGKSRLFQETLPQGRSVYYVGDDREGTLQRAALSTEIARLMPGFDQVTYPDWNSLFARWWKQAPSGAVLALDEFPAIVTAAREIPSLLQKYIDGNLSRKLHVILAGSSQRMMQGLFLDRSAALFGRAHEILKILPLAPGWIRNALRLSDAEAGVEAYAVWGGIPRYWELAVDHDSLDKAIRSLVLSPLGVLHEEPDTLLLDDLRDVGQSASILSLIGGGCHRMSEIAGRLGKPATSLSRPLHKLIELELVRRDIPFGAHARDNKRSLYEIADPFLRFWFRFVEPNRSRLQARQVTAVAREINASFSQHVSRTWEELARASVAQLDCHGRTWRPASRWWGAGLDRKPMEIDVVAESDDGKAALLGEVSWSKTADASELLQQLRRKAENFPGATRREIALALWMRTGPSSLERTPIYSPDKVLRALR